MFLVAAAFNWLVAVALAIPGSPAWRLVGVPPPEQTLFLHLFVALVAIFGVAYFWIGLDISGKRALVVIAVIGKLSVVAVVIGHYVAGSVPVSLALPAVGDLLFAALFVRFLYRQRTIIG